MKGGKILDYLRSFRVILLVSLFCLLVINVCYALDHQDYPEPDYNDYGYEEYVDKVEGAAEKRGGELPLGGGIAALFPLGAGGYYLWKRVKNRKKI